MTFFATSSMSSALSLVKGRGKVLLSLLDMPRPFTKLKALDMDEVAKKVIDAL